MNFRLEQFSLEFKAFHPAAKWIDAQTGLKAVAREISSRARGY